jgi:polyisoprenoid-binding protein YceI
MKKLLTLATVFCLTLQVTSCKTEAKKETETTTEKKAAYSLKEAETIVGFTAYKTTEKVPVKGQFNKLNITSGGEAETLKDAINGAEFSIPVSSIETNDASRNFKIQKFFFQVMENTLSLTGKLQLENESKGTAEFTMNGITQKLPFNYTIDGKNFTMNTTMDVVNWNAQNAVDSLNLACKELHTGPDGVSKTWSEVAINVSTTFK